MEGEKRLSPPKYIGPKHNQILLTGATGFLGGYVLRELLSKTKAKIFCLVRGQDAYAGKRRIWENLYPFFDSKRLEKYDHERVISVIGDITQKKLGFSEDIYQKLATEVDAIYHIAGTVSHLGKYQEFRIINVDSTKKMIELAKTSKIKVLNYFSTLAVSGCREDNPGNLFKETDFHENLKFPNVYVQTKYEAEKVIRKFLQEGYPARIFRLGFVMGDSKTGKFKKEIEADANYSMLKGHIQMKIAPPLYNDDYMDLTPVDYCAAAAVHISLNRDTQNKTFHISNPKPVLKSVLWDLVQEYGYKVRIVAPEHYQETIYTLNGDDEYLDGLQKVVVYLDDYEKSPAIFDTSGTVKCLESSGIKCPLIDRRLVKTYFDYCVKVGFLPAPEKVEQE